MHPQALFALPSFTTAQNRLFISYQCGDITRSWMDKNNSATHSLFSHTNSSVLIIVVGFVGFLKCEEMPVRNREELEYERSDAAANLLYRFSSSSCVIQPQHSSLIQIIVE